MARVYGEPGPERGDRQFFDASRSLPDECIVYAQPLLVHKAQRRTPDYVIVSRDWGVVVLEVKDWVQVEDRDRHCAWVRRTQSEAAVQHTSPVDQATQAAHVLADMLRDDKDLTTYAGKLAFPWAAGAVLPHLPATMIQWLEKEWGERCLLGRDDLAPDRLAARVAAIPTPFRAPMSEAQVRAVCAIVDGKNRSVDHSTGSFKGVYDRVQEEVFKEPLHEEARKPQQQASQAAMPGLEPSVPVDVRVKLLEGEMPESDLRLRSAASVRLVRGFAGTGKTDVLIVRAHYLHERYPDLAILVTTFNDPLYSMRLQPELRGLERVDVIKIDTLCAGVYRKSIEDHYWREPVDTRGFVAHLAKSHPEVQEWGIDFLTDEFIWMKESGRVERAAYVTREREGRGGPAGRTLSQEAKERLFDLFELYQREKPAIDWVDLHEGAYRHLRDGAVPETLYDVILVDEAQHFALTWIRILERFLKPNGTLFLCDDPSQGVYRQFSWRQRGVEVSGRTRWLKVPYRHTRQIFQAAFALIAEDETARRLLDESGERVEPHLEDTLLRTGPRPQVHGFQTAAGERDFVAKEIAALITQGFRPSEIGILHTKKHVLDRYRAGVPQGVCVCEGRSQTGLEYKAVFIPQVQLMVDWTSGVGWEDNRSRQRQTLYMMMARARSHLYALYEQEWPQELEAIRPHVDWFEHR